MDQNRRMTSDILEHLATREPAKTEAQQRLQKKRMQQVRDIKLNDMSEDKSALIDHVQVTRRAHAVHTDELV